MEQEKLCVPSMLDLLRNTVNMNGHLAASGDIEPSNSSESVSGVLLYHSGFFHNTHYGEQSRSDFLLGRQRSTKIAPFLETVNIL